ncbi:MULTISPECIES: hypothetical protein [unclassified Methylobacterium]|uniref:hypothetical protein n=1 Tax=unclassified Methylobacterium TaxID=2615210 RepID=UPI00226AAAEA|nr:MULTISPECIES: hypothetical protein [unclassified Methylobacterium]
MARPPNKIGGKEIVGSGTLVGRGGEEVIFYPLDLFDDFSMKLVVEYDDRASLTSSVDTDPDGVFDAVLLVRKPWSSGNNFSNFRLTLASDDSHNYYIAYTYQTIGPQERHTFAFNYNVLRKAKS